MQTATRRTAKKESLWRVVSVRLVNNEEQLFTRWCRNKRVAQEYVDYIENGPGEIVSVDRFDKVPR